MNNLISRVVNFFAFSEPGTGPECLGFIQFVLLLSLTPFLLNLDLYRFSKPKTAGAEYYDLDVNRFHEVTKWRVAKANEPGTFSRFFEGACDQPISTTFPNIFSESFRNSVEAHSNAASEAFSNSRFKSKKLEDETANLSGHGLAIVVKLKTKLCPSQSGTSTTFLKPPGSSNPVGMNKGLLPSLGGSSGGSAILPFFLGVLLYLPAAWLAIREKQFYLFATALLILPACIVLIIAANWIHTEWFLGHIIPKIAFLWLALRGRVLSKSVLVFAVLMAVLSIAGLFRDGMTGRVIIGAILDVLACAIGFGLLRLLLKIGTKIGERVSPSGIETLRELHAKWHGMWLLRFLGFLIVAALGAELWGMAFEGVSVVQMLEALAPLVLFLMAIGISRLVIMAAKENAYFLRTLGWRRSLQVAMQAGLLWLPMALLAIPYFVLTEKIIPEGTIDSLFNAGYLLQDHKHDFRENMLMTTADWFDDRVFSVEVAAWQALDSINSTAGAITSSDLAGVASNYFDQVLPKEMSFDAIDVGKIPVTFMKINAGPVANKGANAALGMVAEKYKEWREIAKTNLLTNIAENQKNIKDQTEVSSSDARQFIGVVQRESQKLILHANRATQLTLSGYLEYWEAAHLIALILFAFVCVKSFLYVFSRVAFSQETGTFLTLGRVDGPAPEAGDAQITQTGSSYIISDQEGTYFVSRRYQCRGKAPRFAIPQPLHGPIARILHGKVTMNKIVMKAGDKAVSCTATKGAQFLEWNLREGEVVLFDFHNFVGMSENLQISTLISARLSTLLLGKFIFSTATGPGKLILMTSGRADVTGHDEIAESLPPERLVAMPKDTRLYVESELAPVDIYLSTAYVRPMNGAPLIVDVDSQRGSGTGLGRFFFHFIWPG